MTDYAIRVEKLGKRYPLYHKHPGHDGLRHVVENQLKGVFRSLTGKRNEPRTDVEDFWALKDVTFDIKPGEVVGIIGRNGAGKSTLLKILSRITEPTTGRVQIKGRVASLLEVGTGFHPELTGRENIYLNGTILGMTRKEINGKFDEIVAFAETELFLDTPVKHHSSGMYVRLAFAIAAHLEPDILIVDEVLAVGDAQFQKKCLGKMEDVSKREGRTVLFVSHNMAAIAALTKRAILLRKGGVQYSGSPKEAFDLYMTDDTPTEQIYTATPNKDRPNILRAEVECSQTGSTHDSGEPWRVRFDIHYPNALPKADVSFQIFNQFQSPVLCLDAYDHDVQVCKGAGTTRVTCTIPKLDLNVGTYTLKVFLTGPPGGLHYETLDSICPFTVVVLDRTTARGWKPESSAYLVDSSWSVE
jgi:ABC-type polysaccharide/polyol phosphate transport system ATPase subunit